MSIYEFILFKKLGLNLFQTFFESSNLLDRIYLFAITNTRMLISVIFSLIFKLEFFFYFASHCTQILYDKVSGIEFRLVRRNSKFGLYESNVF